MTLELEAKLIPGDEFRMPTLDLLSGGKTAPQPVRRLDATYYDTSDLELVRWGVTLRHRGGEPGPSWTLKLPKEAAGTWIARDELTFDSDENTIPADALDLVRAFTQNRPLTSVARLRTTRTPIQVRDTDGNTLLEIVDDSVAVLHSGREVDHFREVEVESETVSRSGREAMKTTVAALLDAGCCRADPPMPKLARALGERAQRPPPVAATPAGRGASTRELITHLTTSSVIELIGNDPGLRAGRDPEAVHRYRVATRRLRADLRTFSRFLDDEPTNTLRAELRWLGQAAGPVRDLDVLAARFTAHAGSLADTDRPAGSKLLDHLVAQRQRAHCALLATIRSERYDHSIGALVEYAPRPPIAAAAGDESDRRAARFARRVVKRRWRQLAAAVDTAEEDPTDTELHQIRIAAKRCRYAAEAVAPVIGKPARRFAAGIEAVQTVLGDYHDTVVAEAWLRDAAGELIDCRIVIGALISAERLERAGAPASMAGSLALRLPTQCKSVAVEREDQARQSRRAARERAADRGQGRVGPTAPVVPP